MLFLIKYISTLVLNSQLTCCVGHRPNSQLPLLFVRPPVIFSAADHYCHFTRSQLCCSVTEARHQQSIMLLVDVQAVLWSADVVSMNFCYCTLCSEKKHPLVFSFITSSQINQFAQKFQHDYKYLKIVHLFVTYSLLLMP